jgi:hypothetical protein
MARVYVASSWRNPHQQSVVKLIRDAGHEVYDFRNPSPDDNGFHWSEIDTEWKDWTVDQYIEGLSHPIAEDGFRKDFEAMVWADTFVLVQPCGRSAHLELGWACGAGKRTFVFHWGDIEPELMIKMVDFITDDIDKIIKRL